MIKIEPGISETASGQLIAIPPTRQNRAIRSTSNPQINSRRLIGDYFIVCI